jgi:hypothetical protein
MSKRVTFSGNNLEIESIFEWYKISEKSLRRYRKEILDRATHRKEVPTWFIGMTTGEISEYFEDHLQELKNLVSFDLLSAAEAKLKIDCYQRAYQRDRDQVSQRFRQIVQKKGKKVSLKQDILEVWKNQVDFSTNYTKGNIGEFKGALKLRNWLAHGRFWTPKLPREFSEPRDVYIIVNNLLSGLPLKYL